MRTIRKCLIFGDSISTANFSGGGYEVLLPKILPVQRIINYAENAAALTCGYPYSVCETVLTHPCEDDTDLVILWAGTNDWYYGVPTGEYDSHSRTCFCGALRTAVLSLCKAYPQAVILLLTPLFRLSEYEGTELAYNAYETKNGIGLTLDHYCSLLCRTAAYIGAPVCDMHSLSGINIANHTLYLRDGTHPTKAGYEKIANILRGFLQQIMPE